MKPNINHYLNAVLAVLVSSFFIGVMINLFKSDAGILAHVVNVWVSLTIYDLISFNTDID